MSEPSILTDELRAMLAPYDDLFDELTHEQIAEQLELEVEIVAAYHASLQGPPPEEEATEHAPGPPPPDAQVDMVSTPTQERAVRLDAQTEQRAAEVESFIAVAQEALATYAQTGRGPHGRPIAEVLHGAVSNLWGAPPTDAQMRPAVTEGGDRERVQGRAAGARAPKSVRGSEGRTGGG